MKRYIKNGVVKTSNQIVIKKNGKQYINPIEDIIIADGWVEYVLEPYVPTEEEILNREKKHKIEDILRHDSSSEVNGFYIEDQGMWLDKATRAGLKLRFDAEIASGYTNTILWYKGTPFNLELTNAVQMLNAIELYASACYDNTQMHLANIEKLSNLDSILEYDYTVGYPEKLRF